LILAFYSTAKVSFLALRLNFKILLTQIIPYEKASIFFVSIVIGSILFLQQLGSINGR
jgi:hypothetical protein